MVIFVSEKEIAGIGPEPDRLAENQDRIEPCQSVTDDHCRTDEAHDPKSDRKGRFAVTCGINPLIDEAQRENGLSDGPE